MELSARLFGLNSWSILVPQALEGVATVGFLYATVRRWSGAAAGLFAAQASRAARLDAADDVLHNDADRGALERQVRALHARYLQLAARA